MISIFIHWFFKVATSKNTVQELSSMPRSFFLIMACSSLYFPFKIKEKETIAIITKVQACLYKLSNTHVCACHLGWMPRLLREREKETEGLCNILSPEKESSHSSVPMEESSTCTRKPCGNRSDLNLATVQFWW